MAYSKSQRKLSDPELRASALKTQMGAEICNALTKSGMSVRQAAKVAKMDPADIQRIRSADLSRFTLDRLIRVAFRLGQGVQVTITSQPIR